MEKIETKDEYSFQPIGHISSCFMSKNGTPRQPTLSSASKGELKISKSIFTNPDHSLLGLSQFSHIWIIFIFHLNQNKGVKAKVKPPRMDGEKTGLFSTRTPHRPNPIGLTLAKLENVCGDTLQLSGLDIVNGTPVLDVKPFIPSYDVPKTCLTFKCESKLEETFDDQAAIHNNCVSKEQNSPKLDPQSISKTEVNSGISVADWVTKPLIKSLNIMFTERALKQIDQFCSEGKHTEGDWNLDHVKPTELQKVITDILMADPRSSYRRQKCSDRLYYFTIDNAHVTAWFDETVQPHCAEVIRVVPTSMVNSDI